MHSTMKVILLAAAACGLGACASAPETWRYDPQNNALGRIYYYERTNTDGSMDERVAVFRRDETNLEVYKSVSLCRNAALVTGKMDWETFSASSLIGGSLRPDAQHVEFAFLDWDKATDKISILVKFPDGELRADASVETRPWHMFDFDFASLTVATPHLAAEDGDFQFGMPLIWTAEGAENPLYWMGDVSAHYERNEERLGVASRRYQLTGSALTGPRSTGAEGTLWLAVDGGHVVDAILPVPNHDGYKDFRLRLLNVSDGGDGEWTALLRAHFADCPETDDE